MNVEFLGVITAQAVPFLLISLALWAVAGLAVLWGIERASHAALMARRVVLQRAAMPMMNRREPGATSAILAASLPARAPPTSGSGGTIGVPLRDDLRS